MFFDILINEKLAINTICTVFILYSVSPMTALASATTEGSLVGFDTVDNTNSQASNGDDVSEEVLKEIQKSLSSDLSEIQSSNINSSNKKTALSSLVQSMNPDMSLVLDTSFAVFSKDGPMQIGGHDPSQNGFNFAQLEMSLSSFVDPYFRFDSNIVFKPFEVEIEEAYVTTLSLPGNFKIKAGQFYTTFGRFNQTHLHSWSFLDLPLANGKFFGGDGNRGLGLEVSWLAPLPWYFELITSAHNPDGDCCMRSYSAFDDSVDEEKEEEAPEEEHSHEHSENATGIQSISKALYTGKVKQFFPISQNISLMWGLSGQIGPNSAGHETYCWILGTDFYLRYKPLNSPRRTSLSFQAELMQRTRQTETNILKDYGAYLQLIYQHNQRFETGIRLDFVSGIDNDSLDPDWTKMRERYTTQMTFYPSHFSKVRLQGSYDNPRWIDTPILSLMLGLEVVVGAHGSHQY